jgi:hypothetical protein
LMGVGDRCPHLFSNILGQAILDVDLRFLKSQQSVIVQESLGVEYFADLIDIVVELHDCPPESGSVTLKPEYVRSLLLVSARQSLFLQASA